MNFEIFMAFTAIGLLFSLGLFAVAFYSHDDPKDY